MEEIWKLALPNKKYEISNLGNMRKDGKDVNGYLQNRGYLYIQTQENHIKKNYLFHHLVALHFIGERLVLIDVFEVSAVGVTKL